MLVFCSNYTSIAYSTNSTYFSQTLINIMINSPIWHSSENQRAFSYFRSISVALQKPYTKHIIIFNVRICTRHIIKKSVSVASQAVYERFRAESKNFRMFVAPLGRQWQTTESILAMCTFINKIVVRNRR